MISFNPLSLFKSSDAPSTNTQQTHNPTFDPNTMTMVQPGSPNAPRMERDGVVAEQPARQEEMQLRGGGGFCCGICAGLACFECCEICC
ncbi:hypothetical protein BJX99DRAFT_224181 [Aspergillus californicus]